MQQWLAPLALLLVSASAAAQVDETSAPVASPPRSDAAQVTRDGTFLPTTLSARIGDQRVSVLLLGGYETTTGQGPLGSVVIEGALFHRVALRAGVEYLSLAGAVSPSGGVRVGILRQERYGIDLGVAAVYRNIGFSESRGELEFSVLIARRWNRLGLFANLVYGQGFDREERDAEVRVGLLYAVHERVNLGFDSRTRVDLGEETPRRVEQGLEQEFDLVAGPLATLALGPVLLTAQVGVHNRLQQEVPYTGFVALGGAGVSF